MSPSCGSESCGCLGPPQNSVLKCGSGCGQVLNSVMPRNLVTAISTARLWRGGRKSSVWNAGTCHYQSLGSLMYQSQTLSTGGWLFSVLCMKSSSVFWIVKKNCEMRNMEKEEHSVSSQDAAHPCSSTATLCKKHKMSAKMA